MPSVLHNPPEKIYLQFHGDGPPEPGPVSEEDVTWCKDRIFESDILYIRADLVQEKS